MTVEQLDLVLVVGASVVLVAIIAVRLATRVGLPSLLAYLALGVGIGESGLGVRFDDAQLAQTLGIAALVVILIDGGLTTSWPEIRPAVPAAVVLATVGIAVSIAITAVAARLVLDSSWRLAVLLGAIVSSTDAAAVFSVLRRLPLPPRVAGVLEAESGFNDAPTIILVTVLSATDAGHRTPLFVLGALAYELVVGLLVGLAAGWLGALTLRRVALPASGLYPLATLAFAVVGYAGAALAHASGFLAAYLAALVLGNTRLPHGPAVRGFAEGLGWLAQIGLFVMLGLLVSPGILLDEALPAVAIGFALLLVARPVSVFVSGLGLRLPWRDQAFLSWAGLRGAVPIVLATVPVVARVPGSERLFALVFVLVVVFTLVQGPTLPWVAGTLHLTAPAEARDIDVESAPLEHLGADLLQLRVPPASRLHGVEIFELRLPRGAAITLVVRDGNSFVPSPTTRLARGDELLVVATAAARQAAERRLRAVSRRGRLAGWFGERGGDRPPQPTAGHADD